MKKGLFLLFIVLTITLTSKASPATLRYNITDLGTLDGYDISQAWSINNQGQVVGIVLRIEGNFRQRAILYDFTTDGNNIDLGTLGGENSAALSINNHGQIVGGAEDDANPSVFYANIFDPNGMGNNIALSNTESSVWEGNDNNQIVGLVIVSSSLKRAALFEPNEEPNITDLGTLPSYVHSEAISINNSAVIVGASYNDLDYNYPWKNMRAVLFDSNGTGNNIDLGTLPGYDCATAFCVNDNGQIVGRVNNDDMTMENYNPRAVLFDTTGDGNNIDLGTLPSFDSAEALYVNNAGQICGRVINSSSFSPRAVLFDPSGCGNNINLNSLINPNISWFLTNAVCINDNGWIVCHATMGRSCLLTPAKLGDFEPDRDVDLKDFAVFASAWKSNQGDTNWNPFCNISNPNDGIIDELDLRVFASNWLTTTPY